MTRSATQYRSGRHCVDLLHAHLVFTPKWRRRVFTKAQLETLSALFSSICANFCAELQEFNGETDYVHLLVQYRHIAAQFSSDARMRGVHSQLLQDVADRIGRGTQAWLRGEAEPPRYLPRKNYCSFTFKQYGSAARLRAGRLHLSKLGDARTPRRSRTHRPRHAIDSRAIAPML